MRVDDDERGAVGQSTSRLEQMQIFFGFKAATGTTPARQREPRDETSYAQGASDARREVVAEMRRQIALDEAEDRRRKIAHRAAARTIELGDPYLAVLEVLRELDAPPVEDEGSGKLQVVQ